MNTTDEARALEITGWTSNIGEALDELENTKQAVAELYDENQALTISFRQFDIAMLLAEHIIASIESDAGMFITQETRDKIEQFRTQTKLLANRRAFCREINAGATRRKENPHVS